VLLGLEVFGTHEAEDEVIAPYGEAADCHVGAPWVGKFEAPQRASDLALAGIPGRLLQEREESSG
jgi:hypothetical protein